MKLLGMSPYLALPMVLASSAVAQGISAQEIAELAATLPAEPAVSGAPISNRQAWEDLAARTNFASVIAQAEALAQEPLPETTDALYLEFFETGNRTHWQAVASQRRGRVSTFALAECLEGQGRFIAPLREAIHSICSEATWVMPAHDSNRVNIEGQRIEIEARPPCVVTWRQLAPFWGTVWMRRPRPWSEVASENASSTPFWR